MNRIIKLSFVLMLLSSSMVDASQDVNLSSSARLSSMTNKAKRLPMPASRTTLEKGKEKTNKINSLKNINLTLKKITAIKTSEKGGDELYFDVLEFANDRRSKHFHIPAHPHHWPSFLLNKIKDIQLWQGKLNEKGEVNIIVSLLEKDAPPWALNDLIGAFKVTMTLKNGVPQFVLHQQGFNYSPIQFSGKFQQELNLRGDDGEYVITITMN